MTFDNCAKKSAKRILENLKNSTFQEKFPDAYKELLHYEEDIAEEIYQTFKRSK